MREKGKHTRNYDRLGAHPGTLVNGTTFAPGEVGQSFHFNGSQDVSIPAAPDLNIGTGGAFTIEFWAYAEENPSAGKTMLACVTEGNYGFLTWRDYANIYAQVYDQAGNAYRIDAPSFPANQWTHVAYTYSSATGAARLYFDGVLRTSVNLPSFNPRMSYDYHIGVGSFVGRLDEVTLYRRALAAAEIQAIAAAGACGKAEGTAGATPSVVVDAGPDQIIYRPQSASLTGSITEYRSGAALPLSVKWSAVSGPGTVRFAADSVAATTAYFSAPGSYVLRLTATDGVLTAMDDVAVEVREDVFTHKVCMQSGNGTANDPLNRYTTDGGATWQPAVPTGNSVYALIPGTTYVTGPFASYSSTTLRARFVLPPNYTNPSLTTQFYADNAIRVRLNGTQIGQTPAGFSTDDLRNYAGGAAFTGPPTTVTVTDTSLFHAGENILELENFNSYGPMGVDYTARVVFDAPGTGGNQPPVVSAGSPVTLTAPASTTLAGTVTDDALPLPDLTLRHWIVGDASGCPSSATNPPSVSGVSAAVERFGPASTTGATLPELEGSTVTTTLSLTLYSPSFAVSMST